MMGSTTTWDNQDQHMTSTNDDDFDQFFNMGTMDGMGDTMNFDYHSFPDGSATHLMQAREPGNVMMPQTDPSSLLPRTDAVMQSPVASALASSNGHATITSHIMGQPTQPDPISNIDAQIHYLQQQKLRQQQHQQQAAFYNHNHSVPPTPQSMELPPNISQYYSRAEQMSQPGVFDYQRAKEQQDLAFTPFVSPAVTPLDPHFNIDSAFANPGTYFSPLTSPALHAQNDAIYDHSTHSNNSPVEMDLEMPAVQVNNSIDLAKKARKHSAAKARTKTSIKNSPISKPIRRKAGPSPAIVSQVLNEVDELSNQSIGQSMLPLPPSSTDGSEENASVSPENLSDMPPPPVPARRSASKSPYIQAQNTKVIPVSAPPLTPTMADGLHKQLQPPQQLQHAQSLSQVQPQLNPHPATPASLMKLAPSKTKKTSPSQPGHTATDHIESLELPESVSKPSLDPIMTQAVVLPSADSKTPKSATFQPLPSPITTSMGAPSISQSPQIRPGAAGANIRKTPQLSSRNSRKRSTGSVHVSPALLPRISPNIKPLLPGTPGMSAEDTASRMLSAKSNYQHILEGNHVPGVSYPSELSTNLTSKRTSHKIAEQGRRNRINSALQEMAGLLPDHSKVVVDEVDKKDAKGNTPNSKASVVENAIVHLKNLEQENVDLKQEVQKLKQQLEKLKCPTVEEEEKE